MLLTASAYDKYFFDETQYLIKSCAKFEPNQKFYLFLINAAKSVDKEIKKWHPNIIIEHAEFKYDPKKWRGLMCSARTIPLEKALTTYKEPIVYLDSDIILRGSLTALFDQLKVYDLIVRSRPNLKTKGAAGTEHAGKFNSGVIAISPSDMGLNFIKEYNKRVRNHIKSRKPIDFIDNGIYTAIDQEYLYLVYLDMKSDLRFRHLDIKFNDPYFNDESPVWHGKGVARTALKYKREKSRYESKLKFIKYSIQCFVSQSYLKSKSVLRQVIE